MDENPKNSHLKKTHTRHILLWIALILILITPSAIADSASLTVNSLADTRAVDGNCTLREAIENANNNAETNVDCTAGNGADTITFSVSGTITLSSTLPTIRDAAGLTIDGTGQTVTISGANAVRVLYAGNTLILNHLTIANGYSTGGYVGGGVYHCCSGTLTITNSTFSGNTVSWEGRGGGIYNYWGTLTIINSTFSDNSVNDTGGGIYNNNAELIIANSTFTGNHATWGGGGIFNNGGTLSMTNSTIHGNSANFYSGGLMNTSNATGTLRNTIVANNTGGNCSGAFTNGGHNIDDGTTCNWGSASGSMSSINPMLGALIGSPAYFPLDAGSPAVDMGDDLTCAAWPVEGQSQNGLTRPQGAHCDIGSYELVDTVPPIVEAITRMDANPTSSASVQFTVTFSEPVTGLDASDFSLTVTGVTGASITAVTGEAAAYSVSVDTGSGVGTIRLDLLDNDTIMDLALIPLGGVGLGNGSYTSGETYDVRFIWNYLPLVIKQ